MNKEEMSNKGLRRSTDQTNIPSPEFKKLYVNNVLLAASNFDMNLTFGEIIGISKDGTPVVEQKVKLNMSKEFMKALGNLLAENIRLFEEDFGEIQFINIENMPNIEIDLTPSKGKSKKAKQSSSTLIEQP